MHPRHLVPLTFSLLLLALEAPLRAQEATLVEREGRVVITKRGGRPGPAVVGTGLAARDRLGTGESSRAVLRMSERWFARVDEDTDIEITPGALAAKDGDALKVMLGGAFVFSREPERRVRVQTPFATGGLRGTQLLVRVDATGKTWMQVFEGEVDLANDLGSVLLRAGEAGEVAAGQAPRRTAVIEARNLLQWALYYPAVLVREEIDLSAAERQVLAASLSAYEQGDLPGALAAYPPQAAPDSAAGRIYRAAVLLAAGRVEPARTVLQGVPVEAPGRRALERLVAAVLGLEQPAGAEGSSASLALAESYYQQSRHDLAAARAAANRAASRAPQSGLAWTRLAELEFSFGDIRAATRALERGLALAPRHAQAHALRGFLWSADNRIAEAAREFARAIELDGALGPAWLGLGLTKIRQGRLAEGRLDLQTAAVVEPTRALFYSYHAKALQQAGLPELARKDLDLAKRLDPSDPTPWLYGALQDQEEHRSSAAIAQLQESLRLNDHRRVYRSRFLLDQDRAVRGTNLARIFQENGLGEAALHEAARAVESDYASASAHQFLAHSLDAQRDPNRLSLRHETAWFNEHLLAALLAPVGGGALSQFVSAQEYAKLFEADRTGGSVRGEWRSDGRSDVQTSLFATQGRVSVGLDAGFYRQRGTRPNHDTERREAFLQGKFQATPDDVLYGLSHWNRQTGGDLTETYDHTPGDPGARFTDRQLPGLLLAGWTRTWAPGVKTLLIGGRLAAERTQSAERSVQYLLERDARFLQPGFLSPGAGGGLTFTSAEVRNSGPVTTAPNGALVFSPALQRGIAPYLGQAPVTGIATEAFAVSTREDLVVNTAELQQIWQTGRHTLLAGARWQTGDFATAARLDLLDQSAAPFFTAPAAQQDVNANFERRTGYGYVFSEVAPWLRLVAGAAWDRVEHPRNFRNPPIAAETETRDRANAKLGFTLSPRRNLALRGMYTEVLGGVTFDESVRLEPVQLAGFPQAFRTVISESVVGSVEAPVYRHGGLALDGNVAGRTWWSVSGNVLREEVRRTIGVFDIFVAPVFPRGAAILPASTPEALDYRERNATVAVHQLVGAEWTLGAAFRRTRAELHRRFPQVPTALEPVADRREEATLDVVQLHAIWNAPAGWYARADAAWYAQDLAGTLAGGRPAATPPGDAFWHLGVQGGIRFARNRGEIGVGVLNLTQRDYRLSPLTYLPTLPRERTAVFRVRMGF